MSLGAEASRQRTHSYEREIFDYVLARHLRRVAEDF
jgi:hypothetical protein